MIYENDFHRDDTGISKHFCRDNIADKLRRIRGKEIRRDGDPRLRNRRTNQGDAAMSSHCGPYLPLLLTAKNNRREAVVHREPRRDTRSRQFRWNSEGGEDLQISRRILHVSGATAAMNRTALALWSYL